MSISQDIWEIIYSFMCTLIMEFSNVYSTKWSKSGSVTKLVIR